MLTDCAESVTRHKESISVDFMTWAEKVRAARDKINQFYKNTTGVYYSYFANIKKRMLNL